VAYHPDQKSSGMSSLRDFLG